MNLQIKSPKTLLRLAYEPESILLCLALLRVMYKFWDKSDFWSRWNIETEDALFILIAAVALRIPKIWSYVVAILVCVFVLVALYNRWSGNWEFVVAHYQHHVAQLVLGVAILTYAIARIAHKKERNRALP
jgi:hypothetical protein